MLDYSPKKDLLTDKVILVTGAGDGIGRQAALTYAAHGATVILLGRSVKKLEAVYDEIEALGAPQPAIIPLDMQGATEQNYIDMTDTIEGQFGRLDGVLHNAGVLGSLTPLEQVSIEMFNEVMQVNLTAQFVMTKALMRLFRQQNSGSIIYTSSGVGRKGRAFWGPYAISKFATEGMMQVWADELDDTRIRVNCINPGATRTKMRALAYPAENPETLKTPQELMPLYLYLMGDDSLEINGQSIDAQPK
ncbi:NAD(P)-dependent dehydrogenase, short-chain alcohol dehydrogenase family [Ferrimonas sediminum]|uniref:NAD(P)-dependent dehydrogenase, short-chain alcohol dehydrogenase family n=1 Tax=Ferrimonas sediminum TaxID=718193 RepID=A0A1G8YGE1_9GAMM|nr:YciK family oxidoreductase [Ferrimonas sediminum]SDK01912.1 NAD(P)-dependent dehydrogenase, short-chain alcohol dehydrogenase family [Ferrimonas sediminum]